MCTLTFVHPLKGIGEKRRTGKGSRHPRKKKLMPGAGGRKKKKRLSAWEGLKRNGEQKCKGVLSQALTHRQQPQKPPLKALRKGERKRGRLVRGMKHHFVSREKSGGRLAGRKEALNKERRSSSAAESREQEVGDEAKKTTKRHACAD